MKGRSNPTCLIHDPGYSSDECKVLGDFRYKYAESMPTKDHAENPEKRNKFNRHQENNDIVNHPVDENFLQENNKVSAEEESHENI